MSLILSNLLVNKVRSNCNYVECSTPQQQANAISSF